MTDFQTYLILGLKHILDKNAYDHIIFIIALCAIYQASDWKKVLILVTAFTIGHSITLALATFSIVNIDADLVEFLIPLTIFITAVSNIFSKSSRNKVSIRNYLFAGCFGLIHGLGFSNGLRSLLGHDESMVLQLLAFNIGLEIGQIVTVVIFMIVGYVMLNLLNVRQRDWKIVISSIVTGMALGLILNSNYLF